MTIFDRIVLLLTGLIAIYMIWHLIGKQKDSNKAGIWNWYYLTSFAVLLVAGLLLIFFGWGALSNNFVAVVAGLIPFSLASGLVLKYYSNYGKAYRWLMLIGLVLIALTRYGDMGTLSKIVYPLFMTIMSPSITNKTRGRILLSFG